MQMSESRALRPQPLPLPPPRPVVLNFSGCSFTNCVFQLSAPTPVPDPPAVIDDFSDVDLNELFDFLDLHLLLIIERY